MSKSRRALAGLFTDVHEDVVEFVLPLATFVRHVQTGYAVSEQKCSSGSLVWGTLKLELLNCDFVNGVGGVTASDPICAKLDGSSLPLHAVHAASNAAGAFKN